MGKSGIFCRFALSLEVRRREEFPKIRRNGDKLALNASKRPIKGYAKLYKKFAFRLSKSGLYAKIGVSQKKRTKSKAWRLQMWYTEAVRTHNMPQKRSASCLIIIWRVKSSQVRKSCRKWRNLRNFRTSLESQNPKNGESTTFSACSWQNCGFQKDTAKLHSTFLTCTCRYSDGT
jgi:hypothetical protein